MRAKRPRFPEAEHFPAWSDKIERRLRALVFVLIALLVLFQGALQIPDVRRTLSSADRLEGIHWP